MIGPTPCSERGCTTHSITGRELRPPARARIALWACIAATALVPGAARAEPADGQNFENWSTHCSVPEGEDAQHCYIFQNLVLKESGQRLVHIAVGYPTGSRQPTAAVTVPLGVSLKSDLSLRVEDGTPTRVRYDRCAPGGCVATLPLSRRLVYEMKMRGTAHVTFEDAAGRRMDVPVSLMGFTAGLEALD